MRVISEMADPPKTVNTAIWGETQSGKTTLMLTADFEPTVASLACAMIAFDPHSSFADQAGRSVVTNGHRRRLVYADLSDLVNIVSWGNIDRSPATGIQREKDHDDVSEWFAEAVVDQQEGERVQSQPLKYKYAKGSCRLWLDQREDLDFSYLPWALRPKTPRFNQLIAGFNGDPTLKDDFLRVAAMASNTKQHETLGPAERAISQVFDRVALKYRLVPSFDLEQLIVNKGILIIKGGETNDATLRVMGRLLWNRVVQIVKGRYGQGLVTPVRCYWDEVNIGLIGMTEALSLGHTTKMGLTHCLVGQNPELGSEPVMRSVSANTPRKIWFHCASPTSALAAASIRSTLNPMLEHYTETTTKQRHAGFEHKEKESHTKGEHGETKTTSHDRVPIYEDIVEEKKRYVPVQSQDMLNEGKIQGFTLGQCVINHTNVGVFFHKGKPWKDPGIFDGYSAELLRRHLAWQAEVGISRPLVNYGTPCPDKPKKAKTPGGKKTSGSSPA